MYEFWVRQRRSLDSTLNKPFFSSPASLPFQKNVPPRRQAARRRFGSIVGVLVIVNGTRCCARDGRRSGRSRRSHERSSIVGPAFLPPWFRLRFRRYGCSLESFQYF